MTKRFRGEERRRAKRKPGLLSGIGRREFMAAGAGATAGAVGLGLHPEAASSQKAPLARAGASGFQSIEIDSPMARWKEPQHLAFIQGATERYNLNIPSFFKSRVVAEPDAFSLLERNIQPDLLDLTFTTHDGTKPAAAGHLVGPRQVQAMMMAHQGQVVFETYPGMNPTDYHV
jgi:hypothetical protein